MFFPEKIISVQKSDRVLEIGPGADPHPRSDVFLELTMEHKEDYVRQFGHERELKTEKPVIFYDGKTFPFSDEEFDYVICSHVLEHVPDVPRFLQELFRVGKRGYLEYPMITYEYLYNFDVHLNFLKWNGTKLLYQLKSETPINYFRPVQDVLFSTLIKGYDQFYRKIPEFFMEGFEWHKPFAVEKTAELSLFVGDGSAVPMIKQDLSNEYSVKALIKALAGKVGRK